jgi:hypothetical protein
MTKREAAIISAYTGFLLGDFSAFHEYVEEILERPIFSHEMGSKVVWEKIKEKSKTDFIEIHIGET